MAGKLGGKIAVVTGGSAGIGLGIAEHFGADGARVFIIGRHQSELDKAVTAIGGKGRDTLIRARLDRRPQRTRHPGQGVEPRLHGDPRLLSFHDPRQKPEAIASVPLGRIGTPDDLGKAAVFLASDDSGYVNRIELFVDGGAAQI